MPIGQSGIDDGDWSCAQLHDGVRCFNVPPTAGIDSLVAVGTSADNLPAAGIDSLMAAGGAADKTVQHATYAQYLKHRSSLGHFTSSFHRGGLPLLCCGGVEANPGPRPRAPPLEQYQYLAANGGCHKSPAASAAATMPVQVPRITVCSGSSMITSTMSDVTNRRVRCEVCGGNFAVTRAGYPDLHGPRANRCPGSHPPASAIPAPTTSHPAHVIGGADSPDEVMGVLWRVRTTPLRYIPKAARNSFTTAAVAAMNACINRGDETSWLRLLLLPAVCLRIRRKTNNTSLASYVKDRVLAFQSAATIADLVALCGPRKIANGSRRVGKSIASRVSEKLDECNVRGALRVACDDATLAPFTEDTVSSLRAKHPPAPNDRRPYEVTSNAEGLSTSAADVYRSVRTFPNGSAGGISMWRPQHLKDCLPREDGEHDSPMLTALTKLTNILLQGNVPFSVRPVIFGANLTALSKKCGGIRPIAVGDVFRRTAAKCALRQVEAQVARITSPVQLGCGVQGGIDTGIHTARFVTEGATADQVMLKVDFANAFNSIRRDHAHECIMKYIPILSTYYRACYENSTTLAFGEHIIHSAEGLQQGDPLAPVLFCLAIHELIGSLASSIKIAYLDDLTLVGNIDTVAGDFTRICTAAAAIGLRCNASKSEIIPLGGPTLSQDAAGKLPGVQVVTLGDATLLGAALGGSSLTHILNEHIEKFRHLTKQLEQLSAHDAFFLLKNCLAMPKLLFTLRTSPCFLFPEKLHEIDRCLRDTLSTILNINCNESQWVQASLPARLGGLGVPSTAALAAAVYTASYKASCDLGSRLCNTAIDQSCAQLALQEWQASTTEPPPTTHRQAAWTSPVHKKRLDSLLVSGDDLQKARLNGCRARGSSAWVGAMPNSNLGLRLTNEELRIAVCLRLGAPISSPHICVCGSQADQHGRHALSCNHTRSRHVRHRHLNDLISRALNSAMLPNKLEPVGLLQIDNKRPDGQTLLAWKKGRYLAWDASCVHRLAASWLPRSIGTGTPAANEAETRKRRKYHHLGDDFVFEPVVVETFGAIGDTSYKFLRTLGTRLREATGESRAFQQLLQRIGVAIQKGNAGCIMETFIYSANTF